MRTLKTKTAVACLVASTLALTGCGSRLTDRQVIAQNSLAGTSVNFGAPAGSSTGTANAPSLGTPGSAGDALAPEAPKNSKPGRGSPASSPAPRGSAGASLDNAGRAHPRGPATGSVVRVGLIGLFSGLLGTIFGTVRTGTQVSTAYINANGGLDGHKIELLVADDGGDSAVALSIAKKMVNENKVIAFLNNVNVLTQPSIASYLESAGVPAIGGSVVEDEWFTNPVFFPQGANSVIGGDVAVREGIQRGKTKVGIVYCVEFSLLCSKNDKLVGQAVPKMGGQLMFDRAVSLAQPDYTSECISARSAGVDNLFLLLDPSSIRRFADSCAVQGFHPFLGTTGVVLSASLLAAGNTDGLVAGTPVFPFPLASLATKAFQDAFNEVTGSAPTSQYEALAWVGGLVLQEAGEALPADPRPNDVLTGLHTIKNDNFGGLTSRLTFQVGKPTPTPLCAWLLVISEGRFTAPNGLTPTCLKSSYGAP